MYRLCTKEGLDSELDRPFVFAGHYQEGPHKVIPVGDKIQDKYRRIYCLGDRNYDLKKRSRRAAAVYIRSLDQIIRDIIEKLPKGIHTVIGEKGTYLSGGEQQRITIARAYLKDAPILILDEATAFADPDNEAKVQAAFEELSKGKTLIMIAHRLTTVMNADRIFVMDNGRCTESGSHDELMEKNGLYRRMFDEYSRSVEWKVGA